jgi:hypothetical protein
MYTIRREPDSGVPAFIGAAWACVGGVPAGRLEPGASIKREVWLGSSLSPNAHPPLTIEQRTGTFRILLSLCEQASDDSGDCRLLPETERQSNVFEVLPPVP